MIYADDTWTWLEKLLKEDIESATNKLQNVKTPLEEIRELQGRVQYAKKLLNSPQAPAPVALPRKTK